MLVEIPASILDTLIGGLVLLSAAPEILEGIKGAKDLHPFRTEDLEHNLDTLILTCIMRGMVDLVLLGFFLVCFYETMTYDLVIDGKLKLKLTLTVILTFLTFHVFHPFVFVVFLYLRIPHPCGTS